MVMVTMVLNIIVSYQNNKLYKEKSKLVDEQIENLSKYHLPVLITIMNYFADREDYVNADKCKKMINSILKNKSL